jgi:hypothetical protein
MDGFSPQVHAPAVQPGQLGFRCPVTARSPDAAGKFTPARRRAASVAFRGAGFWYSIKVSAPVVVSRVATVARVRIPRSIPARTLGEVTVRAVVGVRSA